MTHLHGTYGTQDNNDTIKHGSHIDTRYLCVTPTLAMLILFPSALYPKKLVADQQVFFPPGCHSHRKCVLAPGNLYLLSPLCDLTIRGDGLSVTGGRQDI